MIGSLTQTCALVYPCLWLTAPFCERQCVSGGEAAFAFCSSCPRSHTNEWHGTHDLVPQHRHKTDRQTDGHPVPRSPHSPSTSCSLPTTLPVCLPSIYGSHHHPLLSTSAFLVCGCSSLMAKLLHGQKQLQCGARERHVRLRDGRQVRLWTKASLLLLSVFCTYKLRVSEP